MDTQRQREREKEGKVEKECELDQWLASALSQYGKAEPRPGLENRVLASLQMERNRRAGSSRWWWAAGTAAAFATLVVAVWIWQSSRSITPQSTAAIPETKQREQERASTDTLPVPKTPLASGSHRFKRAGAGRSSIRQVQDLAVASPTKLDQFPAPRPLSEQEEILMSYVARYPETAAVIAQARAEALERERLEEAAEAAKGDSE